MKVKAVNLSAHTIGQRDKKRKCHWVFFAPSWILLFQVEAFREIPQKHKILQLPKMQSAQGK